MTRCLPLLLLALGCIACKSSKKSDLEPVLDLTPEQRAEFEAGVRKGIDEAVARLKLTPEQEAKFRPIVEEDFEERRKILVGYKDEPRNIFTARRIKADLAQVSDKTREKLEQFLSDEQIEELDRFLDERREKAIEEFKARRAR